MLAARSRLLLSARQLRFFSTSSSIYKQRLGTVEERTRNIDVTSLQETLRAHKQRPRSQRWRRNALSAVRTPSRRKKLFERETQLRKDFRLVTAPWLSSSYMQGRNSASEPLDAELQALATFLEPEPYETALRDEIVQRIQSIVMRILPTAKVEVHGSLATGLCTSYSDIDFIIDPNPNAIKKNPRSREKHTVELMRLRRAIANDPSIYSAQITPARIALIEAVDLATRIPIQISFGKNNFPMDLMKSYLAEFPQLKPILFATRRLLSSFGLSDPFLGGMGSYTVIIMIVAYLKLARQESQDQVQSLGNDFLGFLRFYAEFDSSMKGISVNPPLTFDKHFSDERASKLEKESWVANPDLKRRYNIATIRNDQPWLLCLQDPANLSNDLGSKSYEFRAIQRLFRETADDLEQRMRLLSPPSPSRQIPLGRDEQGVSYKAMPAGNVPSQDLLKPEKGLENETRDEIQQRPSLLQPVLNIDIPQLQRLRRSWRLIYDRFHSS